MEEKAAKEALKTEIDQGNFERAILLASDLGLNQEETEALRFKALWQMSAIYRNASGTKKLAQEYGVTKEKLGDLLKNHAEEQRTHNNERPLMPKYDYRSGRHLSFEEWLENLLRDWNKLSDG